MKIKTGRLRKLSKHLRGANRAHDRFVMGTYAQGRFIEGNYCGSAGCAIGELPELWPKDWKWTGTCVVFGNQKDSAIVADVANFFSITTVQAQHLFFAYSQNLTRFGGRTLSPIATAIDIADNIDAFIKKVAS